jgi:hypothetical protein
MLKQDGDETEDPDLVGATGTRTLERRVIALWLPTLTRSPPSTSFTTTTTTTTTTTLSVALIFDT